MLPIVTNLPNSWVLGRSGGDLADRYVSPSGLTREVFDEVSDLPWEAGGLRILCPVRVVSLPGVCLIQGIVRDYNSCIPVRIARL